uniref:Cytosolic carboxypeptidase N-terminal domain-containing protein n=1 Tax=Strigamia maritima TaxID=126957 RepID=T1JIE4_STRMM
MSTAKGELSFSNAYEKSQTELDDERENWKEYEYDFATLWGKNSVSRCKSRLSVTDVNSEGDVNKRSLFDNNNNNSYNTQSTSYRRFNYYQKMAEDGLNSPTVRWPVEMQVLNRRIQHNEYVPFIPEPLSLALSNQIALYRPHLEGKVVFSYPFTKSYNASKISYPSDTKKNFYNFSLLFESRFESGNLAKAVQINSNNYELYLRPDLYSEGHAQWFYFKVQNMKKGVNYKFSIVNLHKIAGLYDFGMKPVMYSERLAESLSTGWQRVGEKVTYSKNE